MKLETVLLLLAQTDSDAAAYFDAVAATGATLTNTQQKAFNVFIKACKNAGLWDGFTALYPFMGGTAAAHAINAKNPGTYDITWGGTLTHSSSGVQGDGSTGYGDTGIVPPIASFSAGVYQTVVGTSSSEISMGSLSGSTAEGVKLQLTSTSFKVYFPQYSISVDNSNQGLGLYSFSASAQSELNIYYGSTLLGSNTTTPTLTPTLDLYLFSRNYSGTANSFSDEQDSLFFFGSALSSDEITLLDSLITILQTSLGRAV